MQSPFGCGVSLSGLLVGCLGRVGMFICPRVCCEPGEAEGMSPKFQMRKVGHGWCRPCWKDSYGQHSILVPPVSHILSRGLHFACVCSSAVRNLSLPTVTIHSSEVSPDCQASCHNSLFPPSYPIPVLPSGKDLLFLGGQNQLCTLVHRHQVH